MSGVELVTFLAGLAGTVVAVYQLINHQLEKFEQRLERRLQEGEACVDQRFQTIDQRFQAIDQRALYRPEISKGEGEDRER